MIYYHQYIPINKPFLSLDSQSKKQLTKNPKQFKFASKELLIWDLICYSTYTPNLPLSHDCIVPDHLMVNKTGNRMAFCFPNFPIFWSSSSPSQIIINHIYDAYFTYINSFHLIYIHNSPLHRRLTPTVACRNSTQNPFIHHNHSTVVINPLP
jgi:hypothetical protein